MPKVLSGGTVVATSVSETPLTFEFIDVYEDGSVAVSTLERGTEPVGGTVSRTMTNCRASRNTGVLSLSFHMDHKYSYWSLGDPMVRSASITRAPYYATASALGGSWTTPVAQVGRFTTVSSLPANARVSTRFTAPGGWAGTTGWLQINIPIGSYTLAYTTDNL